MVNYAYPYADDNRGRFYFDSGNAAATLENVSPAAAVYVASTVHRHPHRHVTYSLAPNVGDNNLFSIDPSTGAVHFNASPDYEHPADANHDNVYDVVVTAQFGRQVISKVVEIQVLDVNDNAPVFVSGPTASEPAHTAASTPVYVAYATDADGTSPNNTVHYALSGTDAAQFNIDATSGAVTFKTSPSYQHPTDAGGNNVYNVVVTATDGGTPALSTSMNVAISVTDAAPPTPTDAEGAANSVAEGAAAGTYTGLTVTAADGDTISYTITNDTSGGGFKIDPMTGAVTVADPTKIDYESAPGHAYSVTVQASDGTLTSQQTFSIGVTDVAPSTPVDSNAAANTVVEGAAAGTTVGVTAASTDVNGPAVTYSITGDTSGGGFTVNATTGVVTVADPTKIDYETSPGHAYSVTVAASDGTLTSAQTFSIAVTDVAPSTPVDSDASANTVAEGAAVGTTVGLTASSTDVNGPAVTYSITGDTSNGGFAVNATTGVVTVADPTKIDYETSPGHAYSVTVAASDGTLTSAQTFSIAVTDVAPSTPVDSDTGTANFVYEGSNAGTYTGLTASSSDPNGPAVTYSITGDTSNGGFAIDATTGAVIISNPAKIDYESAPGHAYSVTVQASDGTLTSAQTFSIAVGDIAPSTPTDSNAAPNSVAEGAAAGTTVGVTAASTDVNGPAVTYSITGDTSGGGFAVNATTGVVTVADPTKIDYESAPGHAYSVTVAASDGTLTSAQTFSINVTDVAPSAPVDSDAATNTVVADSAAGTTVGVTASSTDVNGPAVTYSIANDTSNGGFAVNATTGVVTVADPTKIDYQGSGPSHSYAVTVAASDGTLASSSTFTIAVTDAPPSTPTDSDGTANSVVEGAVAGTYTGLTVSSSDVNGHAVTYSITGDTSGGGFAVNATSGAVTVVDPTKIDYETAPGHAYDVTVAASDGTLSSAQTFAIAVTDVAPSTPTDADGSANTVAEGAAAGTTVGVTASSTDINGPAVTYAITNDTSGGGFAVNATTGVVTVADPTKIDYETSPGHAYSVTVAASDGTLTSAQTFAIAVTDVAPSTPTDSDATVNSVVEGAVTGTYTGLTAASTDPNGPAVTYSITGDTSNGGFAVDATTGVVTVANPTKINYETPPGHDYDVTVQASDGTLSSAQTFVINVTDVAPSAPVDTNADANMVAEGAAAGTAVGITASSTDINGPDVIYTIAGDSSGGGFAVDLLTGVVTVADPTKIDYETAPGHAYSVTVAGSDGTLSSTSTFSIAVTDVAPSTPTDADGSNNTVAEGAAAGTTVGVTASSTDVNGPAVTYAITNDSSGGGFAVDATTGVVTVADPTKIDYETSPGHAYSVTVAASDGTLSSAQTFAIAVTDVAPSTPTDADATVNSVVEGAVAGTYTGLTASSTDPNGPAVTYSITADTSNGGFAVDATTGAVTIANPTKIDYETSAGHAYDVTVQASDGTLSSAQTFAINVVDAPPSAPVDADATANQVSTNAPQGSPTGITASSMDPNGGTVTYALTNDDGGHFEIDPTTGVVTVGATPVVYDPTTPANDTRTITVQAADSSGLASTADFTITVVQNTPPVANADNITATEAGGINNATPGHDPSGNVVTGTGGNGEVADTDQQDPSTALVVVSAGPGATAGSNNIPVASTGSTIAGSHGELTIATDGSYAYNVAQFDPAVNALNPTQTLTDTFHYTIQDTGGLQSSAAITVTIHGADDAPTAHADAVSATEAGGVNNAIPGTNPSFNVVTGANETIATGADTDPDNGDTLTVVGVAAGTTAAFLATGANADIAGTYGTIHINTDGSSTYTVNQAAANSLAAGQSATDTFSYTVQDSGGLDATTQVTVTVNGANDAPTANPDTATATEAGGTANGTPGANGTGNVLTNDIDPDTGDTLTVQGVEAGSHPAAMVSGNVGSGVAGQYGTITVNGDGSYSYAVNNANATVDALNAGQHLTDTFTYTIHDNGGLTSTSTVAVTINGADDAPVAVNDSATVTSGMQASVNLLDNDTDVDTPHANLNAVVNAQPSHGSVVVNANGTFTYTASNGYIGADSFTYHDSDGTLSSNVATVNVTVQASVAYIDNNYTAARSGTLGSFTNPYSSVSAFNANNDAAHGYNIVYVENGTGSYAASGATIALRVGQYLEGQGVDPYYIDGSGNKVVLQDLDNTATPTLNYTTAGTGVTLSGNNTIAGLNFTGNGTAGQSAVTGSNIANLAIDHVSVLGFGSAATDAEINLSNLTGTASLTNSTIGYATNTNAAGGYGILIANTTGVLNLTGSDNTISNVISKTITAAGFEVSTSNAATATVALQHSTFQNNGNGFYGNAAGSSTLNVNLSGTAGQEATTGNTFISIDNDPTLKFFANVSLNSTDNAALNFNVNNNAQIIGGGIVVNGTGNSTFQGRMDGNVDIEAGSGNNTTAGLNAQVAENAQGIVDISNNTFSPITTDITVASQGDNDPAGSFTSRIDATIVNNKFTFYNPDGTFPGDGAIQIDSFTPNGATTDRSYVVADIRNNAVNDTSTSANAFYDTAFTDGQGYQSTGAHVYLKGFTTDGATTLQANNNTVNNPNTFYYYNQSNDSASDQGTNGPDGPEAIPTAAPFNGTVRTPLNPTALLAGSGGVQAATPTAGETHLSQAELNATVAAAIAVWQKAGLSADQVAHLESVSYQVGDTMGGWLGESTPGHVVVSPDAGGQGWYIDPASGPSAFTGPAGVTHLTADPASAAAGHYDLLTTVVHEMGEQLGLQDNFDAAASGSLTSGLLSEGVRELPSATDVAEANALGTPAAPSLPEQKVVAQPLATQPVAVQQVAIEHHGNPAHVGHDTFVFDAKVLADASGPAKLVAHVADYSAAQHDTLDFTALFAATPRPAAHAADLVHATEDPGGHAATVAVNVAATGAAPHWVDIAHLDGVPQDATIDVAVDAAHPHHISHIHVGGLA